MRNEMNVIYDKEKKKTDDFHFAFHSNENWLLKTGIYVYI